MSPVSFCRRASSETRSSTSSLSSFVITFPLCNGRTSDLEQAELDLMPVLIDGFDFDDHLVAEAQLAAGGVAAETMLALPENPVAADRGHRDHALDEDLVELRS